MWIEGIAFLIVAFLYASVGHGGASGYLALMALLKMSPLVMKPTAAKYRIRNECAGR